MKPEEIKQQYLDNVFYELETTRASIKGLSDNDLYDYCIIDIQVHQRHDLDDLYEKLAAGGKLSTQERKELESFYILSSMDFLINE